ncbi:MAG: polysaccharide biosynthesis/export family protein [Rhodobacterales bacterium]|nr:polysaccharide biosynthesis/export family protein [Rhodobacterales bacterium]
MKTLLIGCTLMLAACGSLPRGAGIQGEVLAGSNLVDPDGQPLEFAVAPVTRASLANYAYWPAVGERGMRWIGRVDKPDSRIIVPGDTVSVTIWNTEDNGLLTTPGQRSVNLPPIRVSPTGHIFLPYIGQILVGNMSPEAARTVVEAAYVTVSPSTQVQLDMAEGRQSTASLVGGVVNPGAYPLSDQDMTLLDLVALAGGVAPSFVNPQIRLQRGSTTYGISMEKLLKDASLNTTIQGGDRIFAEDDDRYFLSLGAAGTQAQHRFTQENVTALDAISIIGGLTAARANAQGILILRRFPESALRRDGSGPSNARMIFTVDLTSADGLFSAGQFQIRPGDLIYVSESPFSGARTVLALIGSVFGLAAVVSNNSG